MLALHADVLGARAATSRARPSPGAARRCSPSASPSPRTSPRRCSPSWRHDRPRPGRAADLVPAVDLRPVLAARGARRPARHPGRHAARSGRAAPRGPSASAGCPASTTCGWSGTAGSSRSRSRTRRTPSLPFFRSQHPRALLAHRRRLRARHRGAAGVGARPAPVVRGRAVPAHRATSSLRHLADLFDIALRRRPRARTTRSRSPARSSTRCSTGWPPTVRRWRPTATRPGATSPAGGSTTTSPLLMLCSARDPALRQVVERPWHHALPPAPAPLPLTRSVQVAADEVAGDVGAPRPSRPCRRRRSSRRPCTRTTRGRAPWRWPPPARGRRRRGRPGASPGSSRRWWRSTPARRPRSSDVSAVITASASFGWRSIVATARRSTS